MAWQPISAVARAVDQCGFEYDTEQDILKSRMNPWQRQLGYCWAYDVAAAPLSMIIDCEPFYFYYDKKLWLIELWKGQYGLETGAEIGLYRDNLSAEIRDDHNLPMLPVALRSRFFSCVRDEDRLIMHFKLLRQGKLLFQRGPEPHWWLTGFKWGVFTPHLSDLTMQLEITGFPSGTMLNSFAGAVKKKGYSAIVSGRGISFTFDRPREPQPAGRDALAGNAMKHNSHLVKSYNIYRKFRGITDNDPNNIKELDAPAAKVRQIASAAAEKIRGKPVVAKALNVVATSAAAAAAARLKAAVPKDVVEAYHMTHDFFHKREKWHFTSAREST